jgi:hypothetical protein
MRRSKAFALAFFLLSPTLITSSSAQNAPQCPISGSPSDWGVNSIGYIEINSGQSCLFALNVRGEILRSSVSQRPAHGRLQRINRASYDTDRRPDIEEAMLSPFGRQVRVRTVPERQ